MFINLNIKKKFIKITSFVLCFLFITLSSVFLLNKNNSINVNADEAISLPILMYHGILENKKYQGEFVISPENFESDLLYLKDNGYKTVVISDLINYVYNDAELPEKPIMLTFDDGYYNNYVYAYPLLKKYDCKMVLSPIAKCSDEYSEIPDNNPNYAHVTWDNINEMISSGLVEIQNHSYNLHSCSGRLGAKKKSGESSSQYEKLLVNDVTKAQNRIYEKTQTTPQAFTYPFGAFCKESCSILKNMGFKCTLICEGKTNIITKDPECLYNLGRYIRPGKITTKQYFSEKNF